MDTSKAIIQTLPHKTEIETVNITLKKLEQKHQETGEINTPKIETITNIISDQSKYWGPKMEMTIRTITEALIRHTNNPLPPRTNTNIFTWIALFTNKKRIKIMSKTIKDRHIRKHLNKITNEELTPIHEQIWEWFKQEFIESITNPTPNADIKILSNKFNKSTPLTKRQSEAFVGIHFLNYDVKKLSKKLNVSQSRIYSARKNAETKLTQQFFQFGLTSNLYQTL